MFYVLNDYLLNVYFHQLEDNIWIIGLKVLNKNLQPTT